MRNVLEWVNWADRTTIDPMVHSLRWVKAYPFLARLEAEIWRADFDPVAKWVKQPDRQPTEQAGK